MDSRTEEILKAFPGLRYDGGFRITSPEDYEGDVSVRTFIEAYRSQGYDICDDDAPEAGMEKVALYAYADTEECTHAARQLADGTWTSKLGPSFDISHASPYTIQGRLYGQVVCILWRRKQG